GRVGGAVAGRGRGGLMRLGVGAGGVGAAVANGRGRGGGGGGGRATIVGVGRRRSVLARRAAGERSPGRQPIAANVDQVLVVAAARDPEPNPRLLDRFLVIAEANRLPCVVILNKIDVDRSAPERLEPRYGAGGDQVV